MKINQQGKDLNQISEINSISIQDFSFNRKQMLIPYRNSVLTSIFRPFFVGRGRTIICCNINPCATFITQTNDLLKFCALAQKVIFIFLS
jgi:hypothetical protein